MSIIAVGMVNGRALTTSGIMPSEASVSHPEHLLAEHYFERSATPDNLSQQQQL